MLDTLKYFNETINMLYITYFINLVIYFNILLTLICIALVFIHKVKAKYHTNIRRFYITNILYNIFCLFIYFSFFIIFFYCLRICSLDLKIIYNNIFELMLTPVNAAELYAFLTTPTDSPTPTMLIMIFVKLINKQLVAVLEIILIMSLIIPMTLIILLSMLLIFKHLHHQIYNLWFYIRYNPVARDKMDVVGDLLRRIGLPDVLEYLFELNFFMNFVVPISPLLIILYDCSFNNCVITYGYYYLLIYIPMMLLLFGKVTEVVFWEQHHRLGELIWDILYKKETCIYALLGHDKVIVDELILNGLSFKGLDKDTHYLLVDGFRSVFKTRAEYYYNMCGYAQFIQYEKANVYHMGVQLDREIGERATFTRFGDDKLVWRDVNQDPQEWIIIAIKYHNANDNQN